VVEEDQHKTAFTTIWGTFAYKRMPFGLINAGATFQRAMDTYLNDLIGRTVVVYLKLCLPIVNVFLDSTVVDGESFYVLDSTWDA